MSVDACLTFFSLFLLWLHFQIWTNKAAANLEKKKQLNQSQTAVQPQPPCKEDTYAFALHTRCSFRVCSPRPCLSVVNWVYVSFDRVSSQKTRVSRCREKKTQKTHTHKKNKADPVFGSSVVVACNSFETSPGSVYVPVCS